jgi:hypothetical protein
MSLLRRFDHRTTMGLRALPRAIVAATLGLVAACSNGDSPAGPRLAQEPTNAPQLRKAAFVADINMRTGKINISEPSGARIDGPALSIVGGNGGPDLSILAGDAVTMVATNFRASAVGAFVPGKVRVTFDLAVLNKLQGYALITPTFPASPAPGVGAIVFPFETNVTTTSGGASVGGDGTEVLIDLPSYGEVVSSSDWNGDGTAGSGSPNNFFNDKNCLPADNDCFRWEAFGTGVPLPGQTFPIPAANITKNGATGTVATVLTTAPHGLANGDLVVIAGTTNVVNGTFPYNGTFQATVVDATHFSYGPVAPAVGVTATGTAVTWSKATRGIASLATSSSRVVGFDVDPTVGQFRARMIVAADLMAGTPPVGDLTGTVSSPQRGALSGVQVAVSGNATPQSTGATGTYSFIGLPIGPKTVSIVPASLPSGCTAPAAQSTSIVGSSSVTVNFSVTCSALVGTVIGTVRSNTAGTLAPLPNVTVVVTPTGLAAQPGVLTDGSGQYMRNNVPIGTGAGSVAVSGLPGNCIAPSSPASYSGLTNGGSVTVDITVSCNAAAQGYQYSYTIISSTATQVTIEARIDMGSFDDPAIPGPDGVGAMDIDIAYNPAELSVASVAAAATGFTGNTVNTGTAGHILISASDPNGLTGLVGIQRITFNKLAGTTPAVTTTNITNATTAELNPHDLLPRIIKTEASIPRP